MHAEMMRKRGRIWVILSMLSASVMSFSGISYVYFFESFSPPTFLSFYQDWRSCPVGLLYTCSHSRTSIKNGNRKIYWLTWESQKGVQMFPWSKPTMMLKRWLGMRQQRRCLNIRRASSGFHQPYPQPHQH